MRSLALSHVRSVTHPLHAIKNNPPQTTQTIPSMRLRQQKSAVSGWPGAARASYYFDASRQTSKTLKLLLTAANTKAGKQADPLAKPADAQQLSKTVEHLLFSLRPKLQDDAKSRAQFFALLRTHFSGLNTTELATLSQSLKSARFSCHVTEPFIDDDIYLKFGCTNSNISPHFSERTILNTSDLYALLDDLHEAASRRESTVPESSPLTPPTAQSARDVLADCALQWEHSAKSLPQVHEAACRLAEALDLPCRPATTVAERQASRASTVGWVDGSLQIETMIATQLPQDEHGTLFVKVMRDILELLAAKKLFGADALPPQLTPTQHSRVQEAIELVTEQCVPRCDAITFSAQAQTVLKQSAHFGEIQILPSAGAATGHAWIAPALSLMPERAVPGKIIGTRFMQTGLDLAPREKTIRQWPPRFLTPAENDAMFPIESAWRLPVPATPEQLKIASQAVGSEWLEHGLPYRTTGTSAAMEATGCRMVVWEAVKRSLEPDARALFDHYNRGLPEPDSPTELWQRLDGLMQWMQRLAKAQ